MTRSTQDEPRTMDRPPVWREVAGRFRTDRECLASFLAMETAEILEGVKPANVVNVVNRKQPCGRNLYRLWLRHGQELLRHSGLTVTVLRKQTDSLLLLIYDSAALSALLTDRQVTSMLKRAGYRNPADVDGSVAELQQRIGNGPFPHEIGIFLGYPLKDVAAFMGWAPLPFTCQGPWRIYGDPHRSLQLAESHRACRCRMAWRVAASDDPAGCLHRAR